MWQSFLSMLMNERLARQAYYAERMRRRRYELVWRLARHPDYCGPHRIVASLSSGRIYATQRFDAAEN